MGSNPVSGQLSATDPAVKMPHPTKSNASIVFPVCGLTPSHDQRELFLTPTMSHHRYGAAIDQPCATAKGLGGKCGFPLITRARDETQRRRAYRWNPRVMGHLFIPHGDGGYHLHHDGPVEPKHRKWYFPTFPRLPTAPRRSNRYQTTRNNLPMIL